MTSGPDEGRSSDRAVPATDWEVGERTAMLFMLEDLGRSQEQIKQAHEEWIAALDAIQDPIFMYDKECRVLRSNRAYAEHAGMSVKEVIGKPYYEIFPRNDGPLPHCRQVLQQGRGASEAEIRVDGGKIFFSRVIAITDGGGITFIRCTSWRILPSVSGRKQ